jgi:4-amino-4-deoxy-L-arabinose transferase-like glycosyltransferase
VRIFAVNRRVALATVVLAAAVPRLVVLLAERGSILTAYTEKSDTFALTFVQSGTYGFLPGHPSAYTQPLYGYFLIPIYWIFGRTWLAVGLGQVALSVCTAVLVYLIGRRVAPRLAVLAAVVATLNPYLIWHDVHVNREITDQVVLCGLVLAVLIAAERGTAAWLAAVGLLSGVAILGNTRLAAIPFVLAAYLLARRVPRPWLAVALVLAGAAVVVAPWVIRNRVDVGCVAITTDGRALWKANNALTYTTLAHGKWIDDVPQPASFPPTPEDAAVHFDSTGQLLPVDECAQMSRFTNLALTYVEHHPGEKAKLMAQSSRLLWDPRVHETQGRSGKGTWRDTARSVLEPIWAIPIYALALLGLFVAASRSFAALALVLLAYNTLAAMVFAGTTRYRVPYDFLLVLLGAAALEWLARRLRYSSDTASAEAAAEN